MSQMTRVPAAIIDSPWNVKPPEWAPCYYLGGVGALIAVEMLDGAVRFRAATDGILYLLSALSPEIPTLWDYYPTISPEYFK